VQDRPRFTPEGLAGLANALVVLLVPLGFLRFGYLIFGGVSNNSTTVRAVDPTGETGRLALLMFGQIALVLLPFAMLAGWRTWHHAMAMRDQRGRGWLGVGEAGACGLIVALGVLAPGILVNGALAGAPYVAVYGTAALILGLLAGLILRTTALIVLRFHPLR
jgi:hypothetical protein